MHEVNAVSEVIQILELEIAELDEPTPAVAMERLARHEPAHPARVGNLIAVICGIVLVGVTSTATLVSADISQVLTRLPGAAALTSGVPVLAGCCAAVARAFRQWGILVDNRPCHPRPISS